MATLVYVHGLGDDATTWDVLMQTPPLRSASHRTYLVPGFGGRPWSGEHVEDVVVDLAAFVYELAAPVVVVGHSLGGAIGTILAERKPDNLVGFVNIEGNLTPADCGISGAASEADDFDQWFDSFKERWPVRYSTALAHADRQAFLTMAQDLVRLSDDLGARYIALDVPKVVIYGVEGYDAFTQEWIKTSAVDAVRVEGAGHWVQDDAPAETAAAIGAFIEANRSTL